MKVIRLIAALVVLLLGAQAAQPQTYPINNPTYIPTAVLAATTLTTAGTVTFNNNGAGTILIRVAGTNTSYSATVQVTESRASSPTWTTVPVQLVGGGFYSTLTANGLYRLNINGAAQVRVNVASVTGTNVIISAAATPGSQYVTQLPAARNMYSADILITPASTPNDFIQIGGSASRTVRVQSIDCTGTAGSAATGTLALVKRSSANSGGTTAAATIVSLDSNFPTASATVVTYSANGTLGTAVGTVASRAIVFTPTTSAIGAAPVSFDFSGYKNGVALRGTSEQLSVSGNGVSFPTSSVLKCAVLWTEE